MSSPINRNLILPSFKPAHWSNQNECICEHLIVKHHPKIPKDVPLICYGYDHPQSFGFLLKAEYKIDSLDAIRQYAINNLKKIKLNWEKLELDSHTILNCSGHYLASEKVLDPDFMQLAHDLLKVDLLVFSVPRKGTLNVAQLSPKEDLKNIKYFANFTSWYYSREEKSAQLSNTLFVSQAGKILGYVQF
jgi:hypothetical protein